MTHLHTHTHTMAINYKKNFCVHFFPIHLKVKVLASKPLPLFRILHVCVCVFDARIKKKRNCPSTHNENELFHFSGKKLD